MAVRRNSTPKKKNNESQEKKEYIYSSNNSFSICEDTGTALRLGYRKQKDKGYIDLTININELDEDGKFLKDDEDNNVGMFIALNQFAVSGLIYDLEQMLQGKQYMCSIPMISKETGEGIQLDIQLNSDGTAAMFLGKVKDGEIEEDFQFNFFRMVEKELIPEKEDEESVVVTVNIDLFNFYHKMVAAHAVVNNMIPEFGRSSGFGGSGRGGGVTRRRSSVASAVNDDVEDDEDEDDAPPARSSKTSGNKKKVQKVNKNNIGKILDDEDEE